MTTPAPVSAPVAAKPPRLASLDALRGFDMFWIIGGDALARALVRATPCSGDDFLATQMHHVPWEGLRAYDLIFPLFMFISGVAIPYAVVARRDQGVSSLSLQLGILRRAALLVFFGLLYNGLADFNFGSLRCASVLGQIGLAYAIAATICLWSRRNWIPALWTLGILLGVAALQLFVSVPGHGAGDLLDKAGCFNAWIDQNFLPGQLHGKVFDPEGLMCIVSASAITLMGALAGQQLRAGRGWRTPVLFASTGLALILAGTLLWPLYPPVKAAWTSTFNLLAGGISLCLLALFHTIIDLWQWRRPFFFFEVIGTNALAIYLGYHFFDGFSYPADKLFSGLAGLSGVYGPAVLAAGIVAIQWLILWVLYRQKLFLKV